MAKLHAFSGDLNGNCRVIIHLPMPVGSNAVGNTWKTCWIAYGRNTTSMVEGEGVGKISSAEKASIVAGDIIELSATVPLGVVAQGSVSVNVFADAMIAGVLTALANELKYYGWTYS